MVNLGETKMARRNQGSSDSRNMGSKMGLFMGTAIATLALASCAGSAPPAEVSFSKAQAALQGGQIDKAIAHAEAAVLADPRNSSIRSLLGSAYMEAGRFQSAATAFGEAIELGDTESRTVLSYALAQVAIGNNQAALTKLSENESVIPVADLGLALALAGQPQQGVHYLVNAVRNGESSPKARQNLAYSYALAGNWRAARVMAAEDVPADQLDARLSDWAATARPEDYKVRVSNLLNITPAMDDGQPKYLALTNFPSQPMMVAEAQEGRADEVNGDLAAAPSDSEAMAFGLRDIDTVYVNDSGSVASVEPGASNADPVRVAQSRAQAPAPAPTPVSRPAPAAPRFVSNAMVQNVPATPARAAAPARVASAAPATTPASQARSKVATGSADTHFVQLGSFESRAVAEGKWREFQSRFPQLKGHDVVITEARVNGRTFFRVAAAGFTNRSARAMCGSVKSAGRGCFAYAKTNPPAGAVDRGVRIAAR